MSTRFPAELLSAYLDGETSSEEIARVELALADSAELRHELDELREISSRIRESADEPAPAGLREAVLRAVERETLVGAATSHEPAGSASDPRRGRWAAAATVVATAAVLAITVPLFDADEPTGGGADVADADFAAPPADSATETAADDAAAADGLAMREAGAHGEPAFEAADEAAVPSHAETEPEAVVPEPRAMAARERSGGAGAAPGAGFAADAAPLRFGANALENAAPGDVVEALDTSGETVAVVRLTVVDRKAGVVALQRLLASNEVPRDESAPNRYSLARDDRRAVEPAELEAVYVEATAEQLAATLAGLQHHTSIGEVNWEPSIEVAQLSASERGAVRGLRPRAAPAVAAADAATVKPSEDAKSAARTKPAAPAADRAKKTDAPSLASADEEKPADEKPKPDEKKPAAPRADSVAAREADADVEPLVRSPLRYDARNRLVLGRQSRQLNVTLPPVLLAERDRLRARPGEGEKSESPAPEAEVAEAQRKPVETQALRAAPAESAERPETRRKNQREATRVPVLFVFVDAAPSPPAAPGDPDGGA